MAHKSTPPLLSTPHPRHSLLWPTRVISLLVVIQALLIIGMAWYYFSRVDWQRLDVTTVVDEATLSSFVLRPFVEALIFGGLFLPFALLLLLSAIGFALLRRAAWLLAMVCQSGLLLACLLVYFDSELRLRQSNLFYLLMLLGVLLVLYLNSTDVRVAFDNRRQQAPEEWFERLEFEPSDEINYLPLLPLFNEGEQKTID